MEHRPVMDRIVVDVIRPSQLVTKGTFMCFPFGVLLYGLLASMLGQNGFSETLGGGWPRRLPNASAVSAEASRKQNHAFAEAKCCQGDKRAFTHWQAAIKRKI